MGKTVGARVKLGEERKWFVRSVAMAVATAKQPFHPFREKEKERKREREKERESDNTKTI